MLNWVVWNGTVFDIETVLTTNNQFISQIDLFEIIYIQLDYMQKKKLLQNNYTKK